MLAAVGATIAIRWLTLTCGRAGDRPLRQYGNTEPPRPTNGSTLLRRSTSREVPLQDGTFVLRDLRVHVIEEYVRHAHADLLRSASTSVPGSDHRGSGIARGYGHWAGCHRLARRVQLRSRASKAMAKSMKT